MSEPALRAPWRCILFVGCLLACLAAATARAGGAPVYPAAVVAAFPHDAEASTQGLFFQDGLLFESTGGYGASSLRVVEPESGRVLQRAALSPRLFGEGIAPVSGRIIQLTWESRLGLVHDRKTLEQVATFSYPGEGWGLTTDGSRLIMSDGTDRLFFLSPGTFERLGLVRVRDGDEPVRFLNELEFIAGRVFCNVWQSERIAVVEPNAGRVAAWIDLSNLRPQLGRQAQVANGIAWDPKRKRLFVTGKLWDKLFEIRVPGGDWLFKPQEAPATPRGRKGR